MKKKSPPSFIFLLLPSCATGHKCSKDVVTIAAIVDIVVSKEVRKLRAEQIVNYHCRYGNQLLFCVGSFVPATSFWKLSSLFEPFWFDFWEILILLTIYLTFFGMCPHTRHPFIFTYDLINTTAKSSSSNSIPNQIKIEWLAKVVFVGCSIHMCARIKHTWKNTISRFSSNNSLLHAVYALVFFTLYS